MHVTASAPASRAAVATSIDAIGVRTQFGPHRSTGGAGDRSDNVGGQPRIVGEDACTVQVRTRQVDLHGDHAVRGTGEQLPRRPILVDRAAPRTGHDCRPGAQQVRQHVGEPVSDPRALQPDRVQHSRRGRVQPWGRVARPLEGGERLDDHRTKLGKVERTRQLDAVTSRPGCRHHGVLQCDRSNLSAHAAPAASGPTAVDHVARRDPARQRGRH